MYSIPHLIVAAFMAWTVTDTGVPLRAPLEGAAAAEHAHRAGCRVPSRWGLTAKNDRLQQALIAKLDTVGLGEHLQSGHLGVAVVDLSGGPEGAYAGINDNAMMYAASLPKIAILLTVMRDVQLGRIRYTESLQHRLRAMITESSNLDAAWATDLVGLEAIARTMQHPALCLYDRDNGGLWMGRAYRREARAQRDPLKNLSHAATARQVARFYTMLDASVILSRTWSARMQDLMAPVKLSHKFVGGLADRQGVAFIARKSGTWGHYHADSALIQHGDKRYVVVGLAKLRNGEAVMRELVRAVDDVITGAEHWRQLWTHRDLGSRS